MYHATKWGVEGFVEAVAQEVAPFSIEFTIVEPGPTKTNFGRGMVSPSPLSIYENTPVGDIRRAFAGNTFTVNGDPFKTAQEIINSVDRVPAPKRLALGSATYASIHAALVGRLSDLEAQKDTAFSADFSSSASERQQ